MFAGSHGYDAMTVFIELNQAIEEFIEVYKKEGNALPEPKGLILETV